MVWLINGVLLGIGLLLGVWLLLGLLDWFSSSDRGQKVFSVLFGIVAVVITSAVGVALIMGLRSVVRH